jgi:hypothetical protein
VNSQLPKDLDFRQNYLYYFHLRGRIQRKTWCMGPYAGADYNLTSPYVHPRVDSNTFTMGIGQAYARVDLIPMSESTLYPQSGTRFLASGHSLKMGRINSTCHVTLFFLILCGLRPRVFFTYFLMVERCSYIDICTSYV